MIKKISAVTVILLLFSGCSNSHKIPDTVELNTWQDSVSYSLGTDIGTNFKVRGLEYETGPFVKGFLETIDADSSYAYGAGLASNFVIQDLEINPKVFLNAFVNTTNDDSLILNEEEMKNIVDKYDQQLRDEATRKREEKLEKNLHAGEAFIEEYKSKYDDAIETESGLVYRILQEGFGEVPTLEDQIIVHYTGKLIDGTVFDSSFKNGEPTTFTLKGLMVGWREALTMMKVGSKWELVIPPSIGYHERGTRTIPGNSTLIFEVELLGIE